jgi:hypothetical protein
MIEKVRVALAGLRFGAEFIPIHVRHPDVGYLGIAEKHPPVIDVITAAGICAYASAMSGSAGVAFPDFRSEAP